MSDEQRPDSPSEEYPQREVRYVPVEYVPETDERDEISLFEIAKLIWDERKLVVYVTLLFLAIGLFIYLFGGREYQSEAILMQEQRQTGTDTAARLLQQFGGGSIDRGRAEGIPPSLYPRIITSREFLLNVVNYDVEFEKLEASVTPLEYFNQHYQPPLTERTAEFLLDYSIKLPVTLYRGVRKLFRSDDSGGELAGEDLPLLDDRFLNLNREQRRAIRMMEERIEIEMEGGLITILIDMPDAKAAAELNHYIIEQIQEYVIDYRIEKYRQNMEFVERQKAEAEERYEEAQMELARFSDQNVTISTNVARTQLQELQNRRDITFNVFNSLAQELEQARIRLQEETPVFHVLQKSSFPTSVQRRSELLLIATIIAGLVVGIIVVFVVNMYRSFRLHLQKTGGEY